MTAKLFKSTDASAPVLTGQVGSLVALLDAVLVNGYGSIAAAGWTKPYTATNKAVFRNSASTGTGFYLDVNDAAPVTAAEARVRGYEVMTAVATGTNPFPTTAQITTGLAIRKSSTADSTARPWYILADDTVFYLFTETGDSNFVGPTRASTFAFGDFYSFKTSDAYRCMIIGRNVENSGSSWYDSFGALAANTNPTMAQTTIGHYLARSANATGGSISFGVHGDAAGSGTAANNGTPSMGQTVSSGAAATYGLAYPNPTDNGLYMAPAYIHHNNSIRGYMKGIWIPSHDMPLGHTDTFNGTGALSAKSFMCVQMSTNVDQNSPKPAECFLETSNTWS